MTLGYSFATNTNYSTGPDAGTATKVDPASTANGFIAGTVAAPQHVNFFVNLAGTQLAKAVDGVGGGTYTLGSALRFQGADVEIANTLQIMSGGTLQIDTTATVEVGATMTVEGSLVITGAQLVGGGGSVSIATGGSLVISDDVEALSIADLAGFFRMSMTPQSIQPDTGGTDPSWVPVLSGVAFAGTCGGWAQTDVNAAFCIVFPLNLNPGDDIVTVTAGVDGSIAGVGHAAKPTGGDRPVLALVRVSGTGVATIVARRADQAADVTAYNSVHTIALATGALDGGTGLPHTVLNTDAYYVVLHGETGANAEADKFGLLSLSGTTVARTYRSSLINV